MLARVRIVKYGILQIVLVQPFLLVIALFLFVNGKYEPGSLRKANDATGAMSVHQGYPYITVLKMISSFTAIFFLFNLYRACRDILSSYSIGRKFFAIKLLVALSGIQVKF